MHPSVMPPMPTASPKPVKPGSIAHHRRLALARLDELLRSLIRPIRDPIHAARMEDFWNRRDMSDRMIPLRTDTEFALLAVQALQRLRRFRSTRLPMEAYALTVMEEQAEGGEIQQAQYALRRAMRLLRRLVEAHAARLAAGEEVVIGRNRKKPRQPHWKKRKLK